MAKISRGASRVNTRLRKDKHGAFTYTPCSIKILPEEEQVVAAARAVEINPANSPPASMLGRFMNASIGRVEIPTPQQLAFLTGRYWGTGGKKLTVSFFGNVRTEVRVKVLHYANTIGEYGNMEFRDVPSNGDIRVSLGRGGYWSYLGTDILSIPRSQQTMNLEGFGLNTPDSEWMRVVPHEFLHSCGAPHEHSRRAVINRLDPAKVIRYFQRTQGWTEEEVYQQILTPLEESSILGTDLADEESIMAYWFPGELTRNGQPIKGGSTYSRSDKIFIARVYPKPGTPPDPDPTPGEVYRMILESNSPIRLISQ